MSESKLASLAFLLLTSQVKVLLFRMKVSVGRDVLSSVTFVFSMGV